MKQVKVDYIKCQNVYLDNGISNNFRVSGYRKSGTSLCLHVTKTGNTNKYNYLDSSYSFNKIPSLDGLNVLFSKCSSTERAFFRRIFTKSKVVIKPEKADVIVGNVKNETFFYNKEKDEHYKVITTEYSGGVIQSELLNHFFTKEKFYLPSTNLLKTLNEHENIKQVIDDEYLLSLVQNVPITKSEIKTVLDELLSTDNNVRNMAKDFMFCKDLSNFKVTTLFLIVLMLDRSYQMPLYTRPTSPSKKDERHRRVVDSTIKKHLGHAQHRFSAGFKSLNTFIDFVDMIQGDFADDDDMECFEYCANQLLKSKFTKASNVFSLNLQKTTEKQEAVSLESFIL